MSSWFSEGTVSVQNGSPTVTGVGTKFSNCRSGDMFVGPDRGIYQVINPASDTSLSISPAYRGASVGGADYGVVPVNGYPKALADAVNLFVQQWGATLAGLGTASTANTQIHVDDETPGRLQLTGAFGWGSQHVRTVVTDLNALTVSQKFSINADAPGVPRQLSGTLPFAAGSTGIALTWTSNHQQQLVFNRTSAQIAYRYKNGGVWQPDQHLALYPPGKSFLSVDQGGTGGSTPALARAGLQLGTAATANMGTDPGNAMPVGAFGLGTRANAHTVTMNRWTTDFSIIQPSTQYKPVNYGTLINIGYPSSSNLGSQLWMGVSPGGVIGFRSGDFTDAAFNIIYHTGNTTRAADGTLKAI
ncbi:hypothetical protein [Pseudomonas shahriarae]|uniref:hypothetical protein n=1 Tax=Pseudomonas shahriarae TaxID=2745512 RepID=UPI002499D294|nr:hypothetical protein [Pseudomonas shahriarae]MDI3202835.1 hypothetical protein [Pseudomonas shahriarae]